MEEENWFLIALFVAVFAAMFGMWWFSGKEKIIESESTTTITSVEEDFTARIAPLLAAKYNKPDNSLTLSAVEKTANFARGGVVYGDHREMWIAGKTEGNWQLIYSGWGWPKCSVLEENEVPVKVASECWENERLKKR